MSYLAERAAAFKTRTVSARQGFLGDALQAGGLRHVSTSKRWLAGVPCACSGRHVGPWVQEYLPDSTGLHWSVTHVEPSERAHNSKRRASGEKQFVFWSHFFVKLAVFKRGHPIERKRTTSSVDMMSSGSVYNGVHRKRTLSRTQPRDAKIEHHETKVCSLA